jgi:hypothetical protein
MRYDLNFEAESFEAYSATEAEPLRLPSEWDEWGESLADLELEEEEEFRLNRLPPQVQEAFRMGTLAWPLAVRRAIDAGIMNLSDLTNIVFFMHHPERMSGGQGTALNPREPQFETLRKEWVAWRTLTAPMLKSPPKAQPRAAVRDVRLHLYLSIPHGRKALKEYLDYSWDQSGLGPFSTRGVRLTLLTDASQGLAEFKKSLTSSGTIVVYMGHTRLVGTPPKIVAAGLAPQGAREPFLSNRELVALLEKAQARIVVLAGCATDTSIRSKLKNEVIVITTASGYDGKTHSAYWARALTAFLLALVGWDFDGQSVSVRTSGPATVQEAIAAGNKYFPKGDSFVLASGDGRVRAF